MNSQQIEQIAISKLKERINLTQYLSPYINENDKTPVWDGEIYIYNSDKRDNDCLIGRMPVQVKGCEVKDLNKEEISFSLELSVIRSFYRDGGVLFFVVYVSPNDENTDYLSAIYYTELLPDKLSALIASCSLSQKTVTVHLKQIPSKPDDFASLVLNCYQNHKMQTSFVGAELKSIEELASQGLIESIQFFVSGFGAEYRGIRGFLKANTPPYVLTKGAIIPQPVKYQGDIVYKIATANICRKVSSAGKVFYTQYKTVESTDKLIIEFGNSFTLTLTDDGRRMHFNYKASSMLRQFVSDLTFMIAFVETHEFMIGEEIFDFSEDQTEFELFDIEANKKQLEFLSRYVELLNIQGCSDDIELSKLTSEDWLNLEMLTKAMVEGKVFHGKRDDIASLRVVSISTLKFAVGIISVENDPDSWTICHVQDCKDISWYSEKLDTIIPVPACASFGVRDYIVLSNIKFDRILPEIKGFPVNKYLYEVANSIMLRMISASDETDDPRKEILLKTALEIAEWLMTIPDIVWDKRIAILNRIQIQKRIQAFGEREKQELITMIEFSQDREDVLFGANVLLDNIEEAMSHFYKLSQPAQDELKQYPIYNLLGIQGNDSSKQGDGLSVPK